MKYFLPTLLCAALLAGCGRQNAASSDQQSQAQLLEQQQALELSQLHERQAAQDEQERLAGASHQPQLAPAAAPAPPPSQPRPPVTPQQPLPAPAQSGGDEPFSFYNALTPYGAWLRMPGYGYLWQPAATVQNPLWRPYTLGHWVFTDDGWAWVSEEPFGWITYHYGRWLHTRGNGWLWMPGNQWAPAWVSWRYGGDYVGWAPLPPEAVFDPGAGIQQWADRQYNISPGDYTFVPAAAFGDDNMAEDEAPPDQTAPIYDASNNLTDIYYDNGAGAIVVYGPNYPFMRSKARRPLHAPYTLRRVGSARGLGNAASFSGDTIQIPAPVFGARGEAGSPRTVRGPVQENRVVSQQAAPAARIENTAESAVIRAQPYATPARPLVETQQAHEVQVIQQMQAERELARQQQAAEAAEAAGAAGAAHTAAGIAQQQQRQRAAEFAHAQPAAGFVPAGRPAPIAPAGNPSGNGRGLQP
jgi:hypothetical protein